MPCSNHNELERTQVATRSTLVSVGVKIVLSLLQLTIGIFAKYQALIADSSHSLSDLVSGSIVLFANKHGSKTPDAEHPYRHHRFESVATLAVSIGLIWASFAKSQV